MPWGSHEKTKREYLASHGRQSALEFVMECDVNEQLAEATLAIRQAIARLGGVEPEFVHARDSFETDLVNVDFWGSLDSIAVILELEIALGVRISEEQAARILHPELVPGVTVADFVHSVLKAIDGASEISDDK